MSIEVTHITKTYGSQKALNDVSLHIQEAGVVGLLGPNGAGKSTLMKILCGYLYPSSGTAKVCGFDTSRDSIEIRKRIGYLPEHNPLYEEMYVREYLHFVGELYQMDHLSLKVKEVLDRVRFGSESSKKIGSLSKGYQQRVGLAQALLPDPKVLILDEPTTGLDPNQIEDIREVLRQSGQDKTVILSTHIMQEAQAICERIIVLDKGCIIADAPTEELLQNIKETSCLYIEFDRSLQPKEEEILGHLPGLLRLEPHHNGWRLYSSPHTDLRASLFQWAVEQKLTILTLKTEDKNLEDVFHYLTRPTL